MKYYIKRFLVIALIMLLIILMLVFSIINIHVNSKTLISDYDTGIITNIELGDMNKNFNNNYIYFKSLKSNITESIRVDRTSAKSVKVGDSVPITKNSYYNIFNSSTVLLPYEYKIKINNTEYFYNEPD